MDSTSTSTEPRQITMDELKLHNKDGDCWLCINDKVYDVSVYMAKHPGGSDLLLDNSHGKNATQPYEDADHSKRAREMLKTYYIGDLIH